MTPDPWGHANLMDSQSWNQYSYVAGDPINGSDPEGLCTVMISGITMGPGTNSSWTAYAGALGADTAYPYQGEGFSSSVTGVVGQAFGPIDSTTAALNAIRYSLSTNLGLIDILAYSGGAAAFSTAYGMLTEAERERIGLVFIIFLRVPQRKLLACRVQQAY